MPEDLRQKIIEAIAASGDEHYKQLLLLLLRVEEIFIERVDTLAEQMTVPAQQHSEDHQWVKTARHVGGGVRSTFLRVSISVIEKGAWVAAGLVAGRLLGVS